MKDYSEEVKNIIRSLKDQEIEYLKPLDYLLNRVNTTKKEIEKELFDFENLKFVEKQERNDEIRYVLFFVYSRKRGRVYVVTFKDKISLITAFPLGKNTLKKYKRKRFI